MNKLRRESYETNINKYYINNSFNDRSEWMYENRKTKYRG